MKKYYAGVGSRSTPKDICDLMTEIAIWHENNGFILRSGRARGADQAFEKGVSNSNMKQIFLGTDIISKEAYDLAYKYHPMGTRLKYAKAGMDGVNLQARNGYQVLGPDLKTPSKYVICWTPNGDGSGGTGQAIRIANAYKIPVYDLGNPDVLKGVLKWIRGEGMNIKYVKGNILHSQMQTLVNPVNCVGVMGKGLAKQFAETYPQMMGLYKEACMKGILKPTILQIVKYLPDGHYVLNFPTKYDWKNKSEIGWIDGSLAKFVEKYKLWGITSVAFPKLGCGNGGLNWNEVKLLMEHHLSKIDIPVEIYID